MHFSLLAALPFLLVAGALPTVVERDAEGQEPICRTLKVKGGGCVRCNFSPNYVADVSDVRGFDVTGVTTEIDLTFPQIKNECDCIEACLDRKGTCDNYVWKFSTADSVASGYRTCTLCTSTMHVQLTSRLQFQSSG